MNEDRKFKMNWYDILSKIIFLIIIILILMWFFPRGTNSNSDDVNNKLDSIQTNLSVLMDKVFRDNLNEMKAAAKAYFTKDRMPTEDGDSVKLTLQDMYDKNMLLPLIDKDGNACSASKSYVKATKTGNKYKLKVSLTCGNETKYVVETIGCYDFCEGDACKQSVATRLQYQFVREIETTKYSCPSGYNLKGSYCYSTEFGDRISAEEIWSDEETVTKDAVDEGEKVCEDALKTQDAPTYSCPSGYSLNGTVCTKTETVPATTGTKYTCPTGYEVNGNYCYKTTTISSTPNYAYKCADGYTLSGSTCKKTATASATKTSYLKGYKSCSSFGSGWKKSNSSGSKCKKTVSNGYTGWHYVKSYSTSSYQRQYTGSTSKLNYLGSYKAYPCNGGSYSRKCPRKVTYYKYRYYTRSKKYKTYTKNATKVYGTKTVCPSGYSLNGSTCTKNVTATASKYITSYSCPSGYTKNGTICTLSEIIPATMEQGEYTCPDGYALNGTSCTNTTTTSATEIPGQTHYSCPSDKTLEGTQCCFTTTQLTCADTNAVLDGNKCISTIPAHITGYKCPTGYKKDGTSCYKKVTVKEKATSKTVVSYQYKWSYFKSLYGWTRTGKTRSV